MSFCACKSKKKFRKLRTSRWTVDQTEMDRLKAKFRFTDTEFEEFRERFTYLSNDRAMIDKVIFRENMGLLGLESDFFLSDRIFHVLDVNKDGQIGLDEYLTYFDILIYGSEEEKHKLTFAMIDIKGNGYFTFDEYSETIKSMLHTWNNITGNSYSTDIQQNQKLESFLEIVFQKFNPVDGKVYLPNFIELCNKEPQILEIFDYFNKGIVDSFGPIAQLNEKQQQILEELEGMHSKIGALKDFLNGITDDIGSVRHSKDKIGSINAKSLLDVSKGHVVQKLASNIRRTIYFMTLQEEDGQKVVSDGNELQLKTRFDPRVHSVQVLGQDLLSRRGEREVVMMKESDNYLNSLDDMMFRSNFSMSGQDTKRLVDRTILLPGEKEYSQTSIDKSYNNVGETSGPLNTEQIRAMHNNIMNKRSQSEKKITYRRTKSKFASAQKMITRGNGQKVTAKLLDETDDESVSMPTSRDISPETKILDKDDSPLRIYKNKAFGLFKITEDRQHETNDSLKDEKRTSTNEMKANLPNSFIENVPRNKSSPRSSTNFLKANNNPNDKPLINLSLVQSVNNEQRRKISDVTPSIIYKPKSEIKNIALGKRMNVIAQQLEHLQQQTLGLIEGIKNQNKPSHEEKLKEEKKIELLTERISHNLPKTERRDTYISFGHQNWNLILNMMIGIQTAIKSNIDKKEIESGDFGLKFVFELVPRRTDDSKSQYKICKFFDYAPAVFNQIRKMFGIKNEDYLRSIGPETMLNNLIKGNLKSLAELTSTGKSGSFFYFSADGTDPNFSLIGIGKYTLKTIQKEEFFFLRRILRNYYTHLVHNPESLIVKFFGCHKLRFDKAQSNEKVYFVIMENVFHTVKEIHLRYDLKGSTVGRITKSTDPQVAKKDLNLISSGEKIILHKSVAESLLDILEKDSRFFAENNIIDYSLLLGIHHLDKTDTPTEDNSTKDSLKKSGLEFKKQLEEGILSGDHTKLYFFGIIDILTEFNTRKKLEYAMKRLLYGKGISAVPSETYAKRFMKFMRSIIKQT